MRDLVHHLMAIHPELAAQHGWPCPDRDLNPPESEWTAPARDPDEDDFTYEDDEEE